MWSNQYNYLNICKDEFEQIEKVLKKIALFLKWNIITEGND